jgi:hypothetical protein
MKNSYQPSNNTVENHIKGANYVIGGAEQNKGSDPKEMPINQIYDSDFKIRRKQSHFLNVVNVNQNQRKYKLKREKEDNINKNNMNKNVYKYNNRNMNKKINNNKPILNKRINDNRHNRYNTKEILPSKIIPESTRNKDFINISNNKNNNQILKNEDNSIYKIIEKNSKKDDLRDTSKNDKTKKNIEKSEKQDKEEDQDVHSIKHYRTRSQANLGIYNTNNDFVNKRNFNIIQTPKKKGK